MSIFLSVAAMDVSPTLKLSRSRVRYIFLGSGNDCIRRRDLWRLPWLQVAPSVDLMQPSWPEHRQIRAPCAVLHVCRVGGWAFSPGMGVFRCRIWDLGPAIWGGGWGTRGVGFGAWECGVGALGQHLFSVVYLSWKFLNECVGRVPVCGNLDVLKHSLRNFQEKYTTEDGCCPSTCLRYS